MRPGPFRAFLRGSSLAQIRHVTPVRFGPAVPEPVAEVYRAMEREFGVLAPPVALHSPAPDLLAGSWLMLREALLVPGRSGRVAKEAVAAQVSAANACPYCVAVHGAALRGMGGGAAAAADGGPYPTELAAELIGVAVVFHYLNRMVNVFLGDAPLPPGAPARALGVVTPVLVRLMRTASRRVDGPGASLDLLPAVATPPDLAWAAAEPALAEGFARAFAAIEAAGRRSTPPAVRALVDRRLDAWDGAAPGLSRAWAAEAAAELPAAERPAGRLALLVALASYQVGESDVADFRVGRPGDAALLELASWASLAAARRQGQALWDRQNRSPAAGDGPAPRRPVPSADG